MKNVTSNGEVFTVHDADEIFESGRKFEMNNRIS